MIKLTEIRQPIIRGLRSYTGAKAVVMADTTGKQPEYPFITIKFTLTGEGAGQAIDSFDSKAETQTTEQDMEMVMSVTCLGDDVAVAHDLAHKARAYFLGKGHLELADEHITVVDVMSITNRDVFLNIEYERRYGFDVRIRVRGRDTYAIEVIEKVNIQEG